MKMKSMFKKAALRIYDVITSPVTFLYLPLLRVIKLHGIHKFPVNRAVFLRQGIYPVRNHYYEPQIKYSAQFDAKKIRNLHIDLREQAQLSMLQQLRYVEELRSLPQHKSQAQQRPGYYLQNGSFAAGDADLYYLMIRNLKPKKIIEIGSGFTTLLSLEAIRRNKAEGHDTKLICIEPYEFQWLEQFEEVEFKKEKVENIDPSFFSQLEAGDFLFIDSSHVIRPENDVLFEYLEILPILAKDVIIHIHDIFTPRHYRKEWLVDEIRLWNEQYLLEAFLYFNESFEILFTLNHLKNSYFPQTQAVLTNLTADAEPGSFWLKKMK